MAVPKKKTSKAKSRSRRASNWVLGLPARSVCPQCHQAKVPHVVCPHVRVVQGPAGHRDRLVAVASARARGVVRGGLPVAVDAMGGDNAPGEIVAGARRGRRGARLPVVLVGRPTDRRHRGARGPRRVGGHRHGRGPRVRRCAGRRTPRWSGRPRRCATGRPSPWSAPATPGRPWPARCCAWAGSKAWPAPPSPRRSRCSGRTPPCCSTPGPTPSAPPAMLVQFAQMGAAYASARYGVEAPTVALLSIGEEKTKGTPLVKETHALSGRMPRHVRFIGNVEGRDLLPTAADVVVTDGFTGNVALKTLEGSLRFFMDTLLEVFALRRRGQGGGRGAAAPPGPAGGRVRPRQHRRGDAARRGRRVHHQPRLVQRHGRSSRPSRGPRRRRRRAGRPGGAVRRPGLRNADTGL